MVIYVEFGIKDNFLYVIYVMFRVIKLRFVLIKIGVGGVVSLVILYVVVLKIWIFFSFFRFLDFFLFFIFSGVGIDFFLDFNVLFVE